MWRKRRPGGEITEDKKIEEEERERKVWRKRSRGGEIKEDNKIEEEERNQVEETKT